MKRPLAIDLFSGAGGMSLGFKNTGFHIAGAVECDPIHSNTYLQNFPHTRTVEADIRLLSGEQLLDQFGPREQLVDVMFGGPPCQGFSYIGRNRPDDPRNELLLHFARLTVEVSPRVFVVENVKGLLAKRHKSTIQAFYEMVERAGYRVLEFPWVLDAQDFGVPQRRQRVFLIGAKTGCRLPSLPEVHDERPVVWDAISDLTAIDEALDQIEGDLFHGKLGEPSNYAKTLRKQTDLPSDHSSSQEALTGCRLTAHSHTTLTRFAQTGQGDYESISRFFRLAENAVGPTLRAGTDRQNGSYTAPRPIHPIRDRCITVREAARLHSFPDWFRFHSTIWHGFRQIGNAVPPRLGSAVAKSILEVL